LTGIRKDGSAFPIELVVSEVHDGTQRLFTGIIRDISERKELQKQVLQIAEEEQRRIGLELHDRTQQELTGLGMLAQSLYEGLAEKKPAQAELAGRLSTGIGQALDHVRKLSRGLVPAEVSAHGLAPALAALARQTAELNPIACTFSSDRPIEVKDDAVATHVYRIAQEAITNALKHAHAAHIKLSLSQADSSLTLLVEDDGSGIDQSQKTSPGIGLRVMSYRATLVGGSLRVVPAAQGGTVVVCKVPSM
jgi:two-component system CheB/CheR fusion protein